MIARWTWTAAVVSLTLVGCAEYAVTLEQVSTVPLPVEIGDQVVIPAGIVVTVSMTGYKNGEPLDRDVDLELRVRHPTDVISIAPVAGDASDTGLANFALIGVSPGENALEPRVKGRDTEPIPVIVTEQ
jgi:hypothetical protein